MTYREPAPTTTRRIPLVLAAGVLVVVATSAAVLGYPLLSSAAAASPTAAPSGRGVQSAPHGEHLALRGALGEADGAVPDGTTVFDDEVPGVANLRADLLAGLRAAARDAARDDIQFFVDSGWRSPEYQRQLLQEAISEYGSAEEAARWVATPTTSAHVAGEAVDLGPLKATSWLSQHGARYGLCQIYQNESWHYELRRKAVDHGCPQMYADPTDDPRMQQ